MQDCKISSNEIGAALQQSVLRRRLALVVCLSPVGYDLAVLPDTPFRVAVVAPACLALACLAQFDRSSLGLCIKPAQPLRYWIRMAVVLGIMIALFSAAVVLVFRAMQWPFPPLRFFPSPSFLPRWLVGACVEAPILEEAIYRFLLCVPLAATIGRHGAIAYGGVVFAALHFRYGNPGPDSFVAGFILAWAFFKSRSIVVPVCLHALGNLAVGLWQVGLCYLGL